MTDEARSTSGETSHSKSFGDWCVGISSELVNKVFATAFLQTTKAVPEDFPQEIPCLSGDQNIAADRLLQTFN